MYYNETYRRQLALSTVENREGKCSSPPVPPPAFRQMTPMIRYRSNKDTHTHTQNEKNGAIRNAFGLNGEEEKNKEKSPPYRLRASIYFPPYYIYIYNRRG